MISSGEYNRYSKELLKKANRFLVLQSFGGKLKTYKWPTRFMRWVFRMEPEYENLSLPKIKNGTIKFRRYATLDKKPKYEETEIGEKWN